MIFVDTSAWLFLFDERQDSRMRQKALSFAAKKTDAFSTSDLVIAETHKWLIHHGRPKSKANSVLRVLGSREVAVILPVNHAERLQALDLVEKYSDQMLSYEDALTVALAKRFGIQKVFSFDRHFLLFPDITRVPE